METTTETILQRVREGDVDAFVEIVRRHQEEIWRIAALPMRDTATTEDLVQQVFVDAYFHLDQFQTGRDFGRWLRTIARNLVRKELRVHGQHGRRMYDTWVDLLGLLESGALEISGYVTADVSLEEFDRAFELANGEDQIKVLLTP